MTSAPLTVELDAVYLLIGTPRRARTPHEQTPARSATHTPEFSPRTGLPMRKQWSETQKADEAQARAALVSRAT